MHSKYKDIRSNQPIYSKGMGLVFQIMVLFLFCGCQSEPQFVTETLQSQEEINSSACENTETRIVVNGETMEEHTSIYVYVCGCVQNSGVYEVEEGTRVFEVMEMAGGLTEEASERAVNLADVVTDGQQIIIPSKDEEADLVTIQQTEQTKSGLVNINTADLATLQTLPSIGEQKARTIIEYREKNGAFQSIEDITKVSGIGDSTFEKLKAFIIV